MHLRLITLIARMWYRIISLFGLGPVGLIELGFHEYADRDPQYIPLD